MNFSKIERMSLKNSDVSLSEIIYKLGGKKMRLPKQVLIIPYRIINNKIQYCIFKRKDLKVWQWISGGA